MGPALLQQIRHQPASQVNEVTHLLRRLSLILNRSGSSAVERGTCNQGSPGSNPTLLRFRSLGIFVLSMTPNSSLSYIYEYLAINGGGNVSE